MKINRCRVYNYEKMQSERAVLSGRLSCLVLSLLIFTLILLLIAAYAQ